MLDQLHYPEPVERGSSLLTKKVICVFFCFITSTVYIVVLSRLVSDSVSLLFVIWCLTEEHNLHDIIAVVFIEQPLPRVADSHSMLAAFFRRAGPNRNYQMDDVVEEADVALDG